MSQSWVVFKPQLKRRRTGNDTNYLIQLQHHLALHFKEILFRIISMYGYDFSDLILTLLKNFFSPPLLCPKSYFEAVLNSLFCFSLLLFPYPFPLPQFLLFHKHIALMGPEGLGGYAISSHINKPTAISTYFPLCFPPMYIFTP